MTTVVDQAENVGGVVSAARLRESFMRRRANASNEEEREALGDAIGTIEVRFPELEDLPAGGAERFARERGHGKGTRSPSHEGRAPAAATGQTQTEPEAESEALGETEGRTSSRSSRTKARLRARGQRAYRETGIPAAGASISRITMSALGATVGLAAVYLLLTSAERRNPPLVGLLEATTGFLRRIVAPEDFFGPPLTQRAYSRAIAGAGQRSNEALLRQMAPLKPIKDPTPAKPLHVRPAELGFTATPRRQRRQSP